MMLNNYININYSIVRNIHIIKYNITEYAYLFTMLRCTSSTVLLIHDVLCPCIIFSKYVFTLSMQNII